MYVVRSFAKDKVTREIDLFTGKQIDPIPRMTWHSS
jgi:hypothetical protein